MPRIPMIFAASGVTLALAACKVEAVPTVYLSDLKTIADTGEPMATTATVAVAMTSQSACQDRGGEVAAILTPYLHDASAPRCEGDGMNGRLVIDFKAPLVPADGQYSGAMYLMAMPVPDAGLGLALGLNTAVIEAAVQQAKSQHMPISGAPDIGLAVDLVNDTRADAALHVDNVFVAGAPVPGYQTMTLRHREEVRVTLSDVTAAGAAQGHTVIVATLLDAPPEE